MIRHKLLFFLILLPILTKSKNVSPNYPSSYEDDDNAQLPFLDQVAQADTWKSQNRVISATYSGDPQTGRVDHANLVINVVPRTNAKPADVDLYASHTLANAKTAEDYVNKALEMKTKYDHTTPSSSFVKYDIYEGEKTKLVPVMSTPSHVTEPMIPMHKEDIADMSNSASEFTELIDHPEEFVHQTTTTTYKHPALMTTYKDLDPSNSDYNHNFMSNYGSGSFDSISNINHDNRHSLDDAMRKLTGYPSKDEMIKYIERAVKKYFRELDLTNKLPPSLSSSYGSPLNSNYNLNNYGSSFNSNYGSSLSPNLGSNYGSLSPNPGSSSAQAEIKTFYRFPSSTTASPIESTKMYSTGIHSEFFKPNKGSHHSKPSYATVKPFTLDSYSPEGVDLTIPSKKRPKPIDLSALDVGQSWSHGQSSHSEPIVTHRKKKKPKIHLNSQTYHDINALPYIPNRGLIYDEYSPYSTATSYIDHPSGSSHYSSQKDHPVGASISFGGHSHGGGSSSGSSSGGHHHHHHKHKHHHDSHSHSHSHHHDHHDDSKSFVPSMQVMNGIPVTHPYEFNMEELNDIFDNSAKKSKYSYTDDFGPSTGAIWNPYNIDLNSLTGRDTSGSGSSTTYSFDTYNPKFNNNPEDSIFDNYRFSGSDWESDYSPRQRGTIGSEMFTSSSNHRAKKTTSPNSKRTVTKIIPKPKQRTQKRQPSKEPDRDLMPPPPKNN